MWDKMIRIVAVASICVFVLGALISYWSGNMREVMAYGAAASWAVVFLIWGRRDG